MVIHTRYGMIMARSEHGSHVFPTRDRHQTLQRKTVLVPVMSVRFPVIIKSCWLPRSRRPRNYQYHESQLFHHVQCLNLTGLKST